MGAVKIEDLDGVSKKLAAQFKVSGLYTSEDLLRTERRRLANEVSGASILLVRRWQAVAELLEVHGFNLALAEGLYANGVESLGEIASRPLGGLRALVEKMRSDGLAVPKPSDDELVGWIKDAVLLLHTGTINGTVVGPKGSPVRGVVVECMGRKAQSDARGRFRLRRLPLGKRVLMHLAHTKYIEKTVEAHHVVPPGVLVGELFRLTRRKSGTGSPIMLSELHGDVLPPLGSAPIVSRVQAGAPSTEDLLRVVEFPKSGGVRVVSRFFDFDGKAFVVRVYRIAAAKIHGRAAVGVHLLFKGGKWHPNKFGSAEVVKYRQKRREQRSWRRLPKNPTAADIDRALRDWYAARSGRQLGGGYL